MSAIARTSVQHPGGFEDILVVQGGRGATYSYTDGYTVYGYKTEPRGRVLEGQTLRYYLGKFATLELAQEKYPTAFFDGGATYFAPSLSHLPDPDGPDPIGDNAAIVEEYSRELL